MVTPLLMRLHISYVIIFKRKEGVVKKGIPYTSVKRLEWEVL